MSKSLMEWKKMLIQHWLMFGGFIIFILLIVAGGRAFFQNYQIQKEIDRLRGEADKLGAKKLETAELLKYVQSPAYVEERARKDLNMIKDGENITLIKCHVSLEQQDDTVVESTHSPIKKWRDYFFN